MPKKSIDGEMFTVPPVLGKISLSGSVQKEVLDAIDRAAIAGWRTRGEQVAMILTQWADTQTEGGAA